MKSTTDLWLATFLKMKGYPVHNYEIIAKNRGKFFFDISEDEWKKCKLEFDGSDVQQWKLMQISLKDLIH